MQKSAYSKKVFIHSKKWTLAEVLAFAMLGWTYNLLPKSELAGLLLVPSGRWSHNLYVEGQCVTLAWSSWAAYPFMSSAVNPRRKALALYPVFLMYVSVGFLIIAID